MKFKEKKITTRHKTILEIAREWFDNYIAWDMPKPNQERLWRNISRANTHMGDCVRMPCSCNLCLFTDSLQHAIELKDAEITKELKRIGVTDSCRIKK